MDLGSASRGDGRRRLLFVDDDPGVVDGLRKALYQYRKIWQVELATSGRSALEKLSGATFDAIVTDARMPEMSGEQLLTHVAERWPSALRVILSGEVGEGTVRIQRLAHHFIPKPVAAGALFSRLQEALDAREKLGSARLQELVCRLGELPAMPRTFTEINRLSAAKDSTLEEVVGVVEKDPSVSGNLLRLVNSAWFGLRTRVGSVREAVRLIGFGPLRSLVLATEVFGGHPSLEALAQEAVERTTLLAGVSRRLGLDGWGDDAATAVVLADVGRLIIQVRSPSEAERVARAVEAGHEQAAAEREVLGADHAVLGGVLLRLWNLPGALVDAVALHHEVRERTVVPTLSSLVALVCRLQEARSAPEHRKAVLLEQARVLEESFAARHETLATG